MRSEFEFIQHIKSKYSLKALGDDCAVLPKDQDTDLLITTDMLVENVDFRLKWTTPEFLGHKSLAVSLSDIAAMGGDPKWAMLSIGISENLWKTDFLDRFYTGWHALAVEYGVELIGGDISRSPEHIVIDCTCGGEVPKSRAFMRSTAKPGDAIFVTGSLGGAAGGLRLLESGERSVEASKLKDRQLKPNAQLACAKSLQQLEIVTSCVDISDGLSSDLRHVCDASGTGASIASDLIPVDRDLAGPFTADDCLSMALDGGEDFELLFTVAEKNISLLSGLAVTRIGTMTANVGVIELSGDGKTIVLEPKGYQHF